MIYLPVLRLLTHSPPASHLPPTCRSGEDNVGVLSLRVQQLDVSVETKTKDNVFVTMVISVQYQVVPESLYDAFYRLTDYRTQIRSYVFDVVRATVPKIELDNVFLVSLKGRRIIEPPIVWSMQIDG